MLLILFNSPNSRSEAADPLSSIMFLIVMDYIFEHLPQNFSFSSNDFNCGILAYADDVRLFANNPKDLQNTLDVFCSILLKVGLSLNILKCRSLSWLTNKKLKTSAYHKDMSFYVNDQPVKSLDIDEVFEYLGVPFTPDGRVFGTAPFIKEKLNLLKKSMLKPQQKLYLLKNMLLPCSFHRLVLGRLHIGHLKKIDSEIRAFIPGVLHMPHDFPNAAFYASAVDGGLGIPCMRWSIPRIARKRLGDLSERTKSFLMNNNRLIENTEQQRKMFRSVLIRMVDCVGLRGAKEVSSANKWVSDGTASLSRKDFIKSIHLRYNCLYSRSRAGRGRNEKDRTCQRCNNGPDTLNHILQVCPSTHLWRIKRHDSVKNYLIRSLSQKGFSVHKEPRFNTSSGLYKPGIVVYSQNRIIVIDVQVVNDQNSLSHAHELKSNKYKIPLTPLLAGLRPAGVLFTSLTANWR